MMMCVSLGKCVAFKRTFIVYLYAGITAIINRTAPGDRSYTWRSVVLAMCVCLVLYMNMVDFGFRDAWSENNRGGTYSFNIVFKGIV